MLFVWMLGMLAAFYMTASYYKKIELGKAIIIGSGIYYSLYIVVSGLLLWINHFNVLRAAILVVLCELVNIAILALVCRRGLPKVRIGGVSYVPVCVLLIILAVLSSKNQAGFYNSGQDEGLYQAKAMFLINDKNDNVIDFDEYYKILDYGQKAQYVQEVNSLDGYYYLHEDGRAGKESLSGNLHGIATFPALLALWGKLFGMENMNGILTMMFVISVANVWLIARNMKFHGFLAWSCALVTGVSPIVMWCSKNVLTETGITMLFTLFFAIITENSRKRVEVISVMPVAALCFYHVSVLIYIPIFVGAYVLGYLYTKHKVYLRGIIYVFLAYAAGLTMMYNSARRYTLSNMDMFFSLTKGVINKNNMLAVVWGAVIVLAVLISVLMFTGIDTMLASKFKRLKRSRRAHKVTGIILILICAFEVIFFISKARIVQQKDLMVGKMSILSYWYAIGYIILPLAILGILLLGKRFLRNRNVMIVQCTMLFMFFVYCGIVWVLIYYYYYYARYYAPFIFLVVISAGVFMNYFSWRILLPVVALITYLEISSSTLLYKHQDLTYGSYQNIQSIASCVGENDALIILDQDMGIARMFLLYVKAMTKSDIYFARLSNVDEIAKQYKAQYDDVYVLMYDSKWISIEDGTWRYVYQDKMDCSSYDNYVDKGVPYPHKAIRYKTPIAVLMYAGEF